MVLSESRHVPTTTRPVNGATKPPAGGHLRLGDLRRRLILDHQAMTVALVQTCSEVVGDGRDAPAGALETGWVQSLGQDVGLDEHLVADVEDAGEPDVSVDDVKLVQQFRGGCDLARGDREDLHDRTFRVHDPHVVRGATEPQQVVPIHVRFDLLLAQEVLQQGFNVGAGHVKAHRVLRHRWAVARQSLRMRCTSGPRCVISAATLAGRDQR